MRKLPWAPSNLTTARFFAHNKINIQRATLRKELEGYLGGDTLLGWEPAANVASQGRPPPGWSAPGLHASRRATAKPVSICWPFPPAPVHGDGPQPACVQTHGLQISLFHGFFLKWAADPIIY